MTARDKTRQFTTKSDKAMRDRRPTRIDGRQRAGGGLRALRGVLRTAPVETTKTARR